VKNTRNLYVYAVLPAFALLCSFDTALAQTTTLTANPPQLTFNTQNGVTPTSQVIQISSSISPVSITATAYSDTGWLQVTPGSAATPATLTVSIGSGGPTSGTDVGFINVSGPGSSSVVVPVTLNANSNGVTSLSATPNALSFNFASGNTVPASQTVTVTSNTSSVGSYTATPIMNGGGTWLTAVPTSGSIPGSLQVTVNPGAIHGSGTFNGAIAINPPGTNGVSVPVLVTIAGTPTLNVSPSQLSFAFQIGQAGPAAQTLMVTSSTGANVSFSASAATTSCGSNWLVVTPTQGATPSSLSVQINPSGLTNGMCTGTVTISSTGTTNPSVTVNVSLLASTNPLLLVPTTGPTFNFQLGGTVPAAQNVQITSSSTALPFTASAAPPSGQPNFLTVNPTAGTTPQSLALTLAPAVLSTLAPGTYTETVTVSASGAGNSPQTFPVTLVVSSNPVLTSSAASLNFNYEVGQAQPQNQTLTLASTGAPLNFQVATSTTNCSGFLSATPTTGSTFGNTNQVVVSVLTTGLTTSQLCSGNLTLTVPGSTAPPLVIPVTLNVSTTPLINISQSSINVTALVGSGPVQQTVSLTSTDPTSQLPFTAIAATNPAGLTWLSVTPNNGNTPSNLLITINPANLAAGTYTGTITVASSAMNVPAQTIAVTLNVVSSTATVTPSTGLTFTQSLGAPAPPSQNVQVGGVPTGSTIGVATTTLNGSGWLTATAAGNTVSVTANGSSLPQGAYAGVVTVFVPGAANSPLYVPVTLTVGAAPTLSVTPTTVNLTAQLGTTINGSATVSVSSTGTNVPFTATFTPTTGGAFATVSPASGTAPATITIALNPAVVSTLTAGMYTGKVTVASSNIAGGNQTVTVNLTVTPASTPAITSLVNGASLQPINSVSPGLIITFFGTNLGPTMPAFFALTPAGTVPTTLGGTAVMFDNVAAPILYSSATQVNAIVPYEVASRTTSQITIMNNGTTSANFPVQVVATAPGIFSLSQNGSGQGAILNQDSSVNGASNAAAKNSVIQIFATGEGQLVPAGTTGCVTTTKPPFPMPVATPVTVKIGGQTATTEFVGSAPGLVCGALQVNAIIPSTVGDGPQSISLTIGTATNSAQNITVAVQ
jgi:trimeric autotransporter adhesin